MKAIPWMALVRSRLQSLCRNQRKTVWLYAARIDFLFGVRLPDPLALAVAFTFVGTGLTPARRRNAPSFRL